jgi:2-hydroxychromene-2-carboxylate isomerase
MPTEGVPCEGPTDALLTVVEYVGYECPFTRRLEPTLQRVLAEHACQVRFCVRQLVIPADQPHGLLAAHTALEAFRQGGSQLFFRLHRAMLDAPLDDDRILALAASAGLDLAELRSALADGRHARELAADEALLHRVGRSGSPQLFIAGRLISGAKPYEEIVPVVDDAFDEARRLVAAGVAQRDLYETVQSVAISEVAPQQPRPGEPVRVRVRFIDVATSRHPLATEERTLDQARALAESIAEQIRGGADFAELARRWSVASNAARGGEFGWLSRGTLTEDVEDLALGLEVGEVGIDCRSEGYACRVVQRVE